MKRNGGIVEKKRVEQYERQWDLFVWERKRFKALLIWWLYQVFQNSQCFSSIPFHTLWVDKQPLGHQLFIIVHNFFDIFSKTYCKTVSIKHLWNVSVMLCVGSVPKFYWKAILQTFGPPHWNAGFLSSLSHFCSLPQFFSFPDCVQELWAWKLPEAKVSLGWTAVMSTATVLLIYTGTSALDHLIVQKSP